MTLNSVAKLSLPINVTACCNESEMSQNQFSCVRINGQACKPRATWPGLLFDTADDGDAVTLIHHIPSVAKRRAQ